MSTSPSTGIELDITSASYVYVDFDYDKEVLEDVKDIPGREFVDTNSRPKQWKFKLNKATMSPFLEFCSAHDVDVPTSIKNRMEEIVEEAKRWERQKEKNEEILERGEPELDRVYGTARGMQLYPFQRKAVEYVENNRRVIIGDEQGTGKTCEAIGAIQHMDAYPALVVCPATLKYNWKKEWETWLPRRTAKVQEASEGLDLRGSVSIINYAILWRYRKKLREKDWGALVLDESHYCLPRDERVITDGGVATMGEVVEEGAGDGVLSYDHGSGEATYRAITERMSREYEGTLVDVNHEYGSVTATPDHPFMTGDGWRRASDLTSEDNLFFMNGEDNVTVESVSEEEHDGLKVYNLGVAGTECYFAGGVLVHNCKNGSAKRSKAAKQIARRMPEGALKLLLTGTAVVNRPKELINQLKIVGVFEREFGNFYNYTSRFCEGHQGRWGWDASGASNLDELHERLKKTCYIRREKQEVLTELPEKTRSYVEFDIDNRKEYDVAEEDIVAYMKAEAGRNRDLLGDNEDLDEKLQDIERNKSGPNNDMAENLVKIMKLKQLAAKGKFKPAKKWIQDFLQNESPLVVFAWHTDVVEGVADEFGTPFITGDTDNKRRHEIVEEFQNGQHDLLALNMHAAGEGITLTEASNAVFLELPWTWGTVSQCEARIHRIGTEDAVNIYFHLGKDTIDRDIFDLLKKKRVVTEKVNKGKDITDDSGNIVQGVIEKLKQK